MKTGAGELDDPDRLDIDRGAKFQVSAGQARYSVGLLMLIYLLGFVDRQILSILAEPIKRELHLADWQMGAITGLSFALLYTLCGIPIARLAETGNRRHIISAAIFVWSSFTMLCAGAQTFVHLALARVGVGIGEAGCTPSAMSLISDYVPKEKRSTATGIYLAGAPIGALLGMALGGVIADLWGWRAAFLFAGAPGIIVALLAFMTLAEPRVSAAGRAIIKSAEPKIPIAATLKHLWSRRSYVLITSSLTLGAVVQYSSHAFLGSFFFRNHATELAEMAAKFGLQSTGFLGIALGLILGISGVFGATFGGYISDRLARRDVRHTLIFIGLTTIFAGPLYMFALSSPSLIPALLLLFIPSALMHFYHGPAFGMIQGVVAPSQRATATAIMLLIVNLIGLGVGPLVVGLTSDLIAHFGHMSDGEGVRWALYSVIMLTIPTGLLFIVVRNYIAGEQES
ncbi:MAG: spinster family MFS transporter [Parasphingorhabdus sp.]